MNVVKGEHEWSKFLKFFNEHNCGRLTRLGVFEKADNVVTDYWLECGLRLEGIDIDDRAALPSIQISVGDLTHEVNRAVSLVFRFSQSGDEDGLDLTDAEGRTTILRFETVGGAA